MKKIHIITLVLVLLWVVTGCGNQANSDQKTTNLTMGVEPWIGYGPWWIADKKGIFKKNGLNVKITTFKQDSDINAAFASDKIKVANIASHTAIKMKGNNGIDLKSIVFLDESQTADAVISTKKYQSLDQLKGKKVAFEEGTTSDLLFRQALKAHHLTITDFKIVYMPASDAGLALSSGKVDAAVTYEPYIASITAKNASIHSIYTAKQSAGLISDVAAVKQSYLAKNKSIKSKLQKSWKESLSYWEKHKKEGNAIIAEATGTPSDQLPTILKGLKFFSLEEQKDRQDELLKGYENIEKILLAQKTLKKAIDVSELLDMK
ncbi:MAG: ABC transporter substrate-binding protein [Sporolactobacillus sp.]|nr:ABC transporter substrate-binding protein [Sporolactobacillus sp.]MCI1882845.1 ABC transporter substrate-binding protein [Sporolactobacillus sp.]